ncbi:MAG: Holliday junction branch migration protein RuvA, partial [Alphaproteobacteria bacterium]|nr:Holliday junction branch migration protein RuvA [Alphaproteobacteria bacterium]
MIGKLTGTVDGIAADRLILDVGGVGYEVMASAGVLRRAAPGARLALAIDTHVRQDAIVLYGFADEDERGWFRLLQSVQGVGAKIALSLLSALPEGALARAIALQDKAALQSAD